MRPKSKAWYYKIPGSFHAYGPVRFPRRVGERTVRATVRRVWGLERLPRFTLFWPTSD